MASDDALRPPTATFPYPRRPQRKKCNVENVGKVPAFVSALWSMLNDDRWNDIVHWSTDGTSFIIEDEKALSEHVLPQYFNTISVASFGRQLNFYNFKRVTDEDTPEDEVATTLLAQINGERPKRRDLIEYKHKFFQRDAPDLLTKVIRKTNHRVIKQMMEARQAVRAVQAAAASVHISDSASHSGSRNSGDSRMTRSRARGGAGSYEGEEREYPMRRVPVTSRTLQDAGIQLVAATTTTISMPGRSVYTNSQAPIQSLDMLDDALVGLVSPSKAEGYLAGSRSRRKAGASNPDIPLTALLDGDDDTNILETGGAAALVNVLASLGVHLDVDALTANDPAERRRVNLGSATPSPVPNLSANALRNALIKLGISIDMSTLTGLGFPESMASSICAVAQGGSEGRATRRSRRRSQQSRQSDSDIESASPVRRTSSRSQRGGGDRDDVSESEWRYKPRTESRRRRSRQEDADLVYDPYTATFTSRDAWAEKPALNVHGNEGGYVADSNSSLESASSPALQQAALQLFLARLQSKTDPLMSSSSSSSDDKWPGGGDPSQVPIAQALSQLAASASQMLGAQSTPAAAEATGFPANTQLSPDQLISAVESLGLAKDVTSALVGLIKQASQQVPPAAGTNPQPPAQPAALPNSVFMLNDHGDLVEYDMVSVPYDTLMAFDPAKDDHDHSRSAQFGLAAVHSGDVGESHEEAVRSPHSTLQMQQNNPFPHTSFASTLLPSDSTMPAIVPPQPSAITHDFTSPTSSLRPTQPNTASRTDYGDLTPVLRAFMRQKFADDNTGKASESRIMFASPAAYLRASKFPRPQPAESPTHGTESTNEAAAGNSGHAAPGPDIFFLSPRNVVSAKHHKTEGSLLQRRGVDSPSLIISVPTSGGSDQVVHTTTNAAPEGMPSSTASVTSLGHILPSQAGGVQLKPFSSQSPQSHFLKSPLGLGEMHRMTEENKADALRKRPRPGPAQSALEEAGSAAKRSRTDEEQSTPSGSPSASKSPMKQIQEDEAQFNTGRTPKGAVNARRATRLSVPMPAPLPASTTAASLPTPVGINTKAFVRSNPHERKLSGGDSSSSTQTMFDQPHLSGDDGDHPFEVHA